MKYEIEISLDLGKIVPPVQELTNSINAGLATFGREEKVGIRTKMVLALEVNCQLTQDQQNEMATLVKTTYAEFDGKVVEFRCKPGNVSQSVSQ